MTGPFIFNFLLLWPLLLSYYYFILLKEVFHYYEQIKKLMIKHSFLRLLFIASLLPCDNNLHNIQHLHWLFLRKNIITRHFNSCLDLCSFSIYLLTKTQGRVHNNIKYDIWRDKSRLAKSLNETIQPYLWIVTCYRLKSFVYSEDLLHCIALHWHWLWDSKKIYKLIKCVSCLRCCFRR